jgi:hypothetical protein
MPSSPKFNHESAQAQAHLDPAQRVLDCAPNTPVRRRRVPLAAVAATLSFVGLGLGGCDRGDPSTAAALGAPGGPSTGFDASGGAVPPNFSYARPVLELPPEAPRAPGEVPLHETERDWAIAQGTVAWARSQGLEALPVGELVALLGPTFVGAPYEPGTLELAGSERLVVNLRTFDCVTFVEHVLVLARLVRDPTVNPGLEPSLDANTRTAAAEAFRERYRAELTRLRYRGGVLEGYVSRLHYFTEWLDDAVEKGLVDDVTAALGGVPDPRAIHFMTSNPDAYRQLSEDPTLIDPIRAIETVLSARTRRFVPEDQIAAVESGIQSGDLIATVSTLDGLDIAHTGIAIRHEGRIHLLHAPLVGDSVEISLVPLAERIQGLSRQSGIRVVRPRDLR